MKKVYPTAEAALKDIVKDGMLVAAGGFGLCGMPETLIKALRDSGVKNLTCISNNAGIDGAGLGLLLETRQIKKMIASYVGENKLFAQQFLAGELGKEERTFDGERYIMERGLVPDLALVHAWMGDTEGNLVYRKTARNFNPPMATAGKITVAEVEHLVKPGELNPDAIITPGVFVHRIVHVGDANKRIEVRTVRKRPAAAATGGDI